MAKHVDQDDGLCSGQRRRPHRVLPSWRMRVACTRVCAFACLSRHFARISVHGARRRLSDLPPAPPTSILIVPRGPRLVRSTSSSPLAALRFMKRAAADPMSSALGLRLRKEDEAMASNRVDRVGRNCREMVQERRPLDPPPPIKDPSSPFNEGIDRTRFPFRKGRRERRVKEGGRDGPGPWMETMVKPIIHGCEIHTHSTPRTRIQTQERKERDGTVLGPVREDGGAPTTGTTTVDVERRTRAEPKMSPKTTNYEREIPSQPRGGGTSLMSDSNASKRSICLRRYMR